MQNKIELVNVEKAYGSNPPIMKHLNLSIKEGSFTVLLGASGCGKSTVLRMIAGLELPTAGSVYINGENMKGVPPGDRDVAMVFQNYALYPTMTVYGNLEFGLKNARVPLEERSKRIAEIAEMVGLSDYLDRKPQHLSGGQRQRVALARAIVKKPGVFLMDEPLSNLDAKLRAQIRSDLIQIYRRLGATFLYVTHDQVEAMSMGTDIILIDRGEIQQMGSPEGIYRKPANVFSAKFIGSPPMNVLPYAELLRHSAVTPGAESHIEPHYVGFRPEHALLNDTRTVPGDVHLRGDILAREMLGDQTLYVVETPCGVVQIKSFRRNLLEYGACRIRIPAADVCTFDAQAMRIPGYEEAV